MFGSQALEVAIGLIFVYLLLSLICSALNEWASQLTDKRSKMLKEGIEKLLSGAMKADDFLKHPLIASLTPKNRSIDYLPGRTFALALLDFVAPAQSGTTYSAQTLTEIRQNLKHDQPLHRALINLIDQASGDFAKARANIEQWFDDAMGHVTKWYKQHVQRILFAIAIVITMALNIDTINIVSTLWNHDAVRASVVAAAENYVQNNKSETPATQLGDLSKQVGELQSLQIPLGWTNPQSIPSNFLGWMMKILGWFCTALAGSMGAPFWFDLLKKFIEMRSTEKKQPEKAN